MAKAPSRAELREELGRERAQSAFLEETLEQLTGTGNLTEALAELELGLEDVGWIRESLYASREFSREGLQRLVYRCRLAYLKDPLIRRGVEISAHYVWGQGVEIRAKHQLVNDLVVQPFLDDRQNQKAFSGHQARMQMERQLRTEGNVFFALFTDLVTGFVRVRKIPMLEISRVITSPEDSGEVRYYHRRWQEAQEGSELGFTPTTDRQVLYPDISYTPADKPREIGGVEVMWDAPIFHVAVGGLEGMSFGVPEIYPALDWANAVKNDLQDYTKIRRALTRYAWNLNVAGGTGAVKRARDRLASTLDAGGGGQMETNPPATTGATFIGSLGAKLEPIRTAGSTTSPEESKMLHLQVSAALGIPITMLEGDAEAGNYATAKTLDRPTELMMVDRQELWTDTISQIVDYVIDQAALAPDKALPGFVDVDAYSGLEHVVLGKDETADPDPVTGELPDITRDLVVKYPSILERDSKERIEGIVKGATLGNTMGIPAGTIPPRVLTGLLLDVLGVDDVDEVLDVMFPEGAGQGDPAEELPAAAPAAPGPGDQAVVEALSAVKEAALTLVQSRNGHSH